MCNTVDNVYWCTVEMIYQGLHALFSHAVILIGFNTNSISLNSSESDGNVSLVISVFNNMTIGEGNTVRVRITTADNSAHGRAQLTV